MRKISGNSEIFTGGDLEDYTGEARTASPRKNKKRITELSKLAFRTK